MKEWRGWELDAAWYEKLRLLEQRELHHIIVAGAEIVGVSRYGDFSVNTDWYTPPCAQAQVRLRDMTDTVILRIPISRYVTRILAKFLCNNACGVPAGLARRYRNLYRKHGIWLSVRPFRFYFMVFISFSFIGVHA